MGNIYDHNYTVVSMNGDRKGGLVTKSTFLHNTKFASSKIAEDEIKNAKRDKKQPHGRIISLTEMLHCMLRCAEVYTNLICISISTMPQELSIGGVKVDTDKNIEDGAYTQSVSNHIRSNKVNLPPWINHT